MQVYDAIMSRRTVRKFSQKPIPEEMLIKLVDCARMAAYAANIQPLKFAIIHAPDLCEKVFPFTKWAGYLEDGAPKENERPTAYLALLGDTTLKKSFDLDTGAAGTTILLAAEEMGLGACWIGSLDKPALSELFNLDATLSLTHLIALGYPAEKSRPVPMEADVKYFYTSDSYLNVPKRCLEDVLINIR